jgi:hypothetical protein
MEAVTIPASTPITGRSQPEFELLLCCARTVPDAARIEALTNAEIDWQSLLDLATRHRVRLLVYLTLRTTCWERIPADVRIEWQEAYQSLTGKNLFITGELLRVTAEFQSRGTCVAVLKGPVIAEMAYGDFALREFGDLDLLVQEADFPRTVDLLQHLGYTPFWEYDHRKVARFLRHVGEYKLMSDLGTEIDLHWRVATKATALSPGVNDFPCGFQPVSIAGAAVLSLAPQDLPLYLAAQGGWDQWCDLRRICDLAEFLRSHPDIDWEPHLNTAKRLGGLRSMLTGLALAARLLGATIPESIATRIDADPRVDDLVKRTIQKLQRPVEGGESGEATSRYVFQMKAKQGLRGKIALARSIVMDRTAEDGSWVMLPRPLWWLYGVLRPVRMSGKILRRV